MDDGDDGGGLAPNDARLFQPPLRGFPHDVVAPMLCSFFLFVLSGGTSLVVLRRWLRDSVIVVIYDANNTQ